MFLIVGNADPKKKECTCIKHKFDSIDTSPNTLDGSIKYCKRLDSCL